MFFLSQSYYFQAFMNIIHSLPLKRQIYLLQRELTLWSINRHVKYYKTDLIPQVQRVPDHQQRLYSNRDSHFYSFLQPLHTAQKNCLFSVLCIYLLPLASLEKHPSLRQPMFIPSFKTGLKTLPVWLEDNFP